MNYLNLLFMVVGYIVTVTYGSIKLYPILMRLIDEVTINQTIKRLDKLKDELENRA